MKLPIPVTYPAMEAKLVAALPEGPQWQYEPKFDGFRCLAFKDGDEIDLRSKSGQPFNRYFPEVVAALQKLSAEQFVVDGELIVQVGKALSFDDLLMRIHPAESRVQKLARQTPAFFVLFDLMVDDKGRSLTDEPMTERRAALEGFVKRHVRGETLIRLSPHTTDMREVKEWFRSFGGGLDGVMAKRGDLAYQSGNRLGMQKYKQMRTADCVVGGFRYASKGEVVGSLLLGLYDDAGLLDHVGFSANIKAGEKPALTKKLEKLIEEPGFTGAAPGRPSRWSSERSGEWKPLATKLVVEVQYEHFSGGRFRHGTKFLRWRPDKAPEQCTLKQVERESRSMLGLISAKNA